MSEPRRRDEVYFSRFRVMRASLARRWGVARDAAKSLARDRAWLGWMLLIVLLVAVAYWVGVRTEDPPADLRSVGVIAQVQGHRAQPGFNVPSGGRCRSCAGGNDIMRYNPGAGLRVDIVVRVHPTLFPASCGDATVDMVISGTAPFWAQHNRLGPGVATRIAVGWDRQTHPRLPAGVTQPAVAHGAPALTVFYDDPQAPLHPGLYLI